MDYKKFELNIKPKKFSGENFAKMTLPKMSGFIFNIIRVGPRLILRSIFELLRANIVTRLLSVIVLVSYDAYNFAKKKISKKQFIINLILAFLLLLSGTVGWYGGHTAAGVFFENAVLAIVFGVISAGVFGVVISKIYEWFIKRFVNDDSKEMLNIFNKKFQDLCEKHNCTEEQCHELCENIELREQFVKNIFLHEEKEKYAESILEPYFKEMEIEKS